MLPEKLLLNNKINNLLIYPLKDKYDKIHGVIEAMNKIQDNEINKYNNDNYYSNKASFNKNDEIIIALISKHLGNFCNYYNIINYKSSYLSNYHTLFIFWQKLFIQNEINNKNNIFYMINEVIELSKKIFEMNDIQFLLCKKESFCDIQKNKSIPFEGLVYKSYLDKKIIYTRNHFENNNFFNKSDLTENAFNINKNEEIIIIPIRELFKNDIIMILKIKTNKRLGINYNNDKLNIDDYKLNDDNYFTIENISFILQKYLSENIELIQKSDNFYKIIN